jgi:FAD/FMN-containing dehydrogenase
MYRNNSRRVWNGLIDKKPAVIVEARTYADVGHIVRLCHKFRVPLTVRGGGHNVAGLAVCHPPPPHIIYIYIYIYII